NGGGDIVVSKLSADGSTVLWSTYLGGGGGDAAGDLALDGNGDLVVAGSTTSTDFPVTAGAHDGTANGGTDGVVFELDDTGATLHGSTYLGGSSFDRATRVTVDPGGSVVVAGETSSGDFPAGVGAFDPDKSNVGGPTDGFVAKLPADLTALGWATFVGDSGDEWMGDIDTDSTGAVWLSLTSTGALPAVNAYDSTANGGGDVWLARLSADGTTLDYATWLGGTGSETGPSAIEVHGDDRIYVGSVATTGFPTTAGSYDPTADAAEAGLVVLDPTAVGAAQLVYGTALGGASGSWISDVITDPGGRAYLVGDITQAGLATDGAPDPTVGGAWDGLVAVLDPAHATLDLRTYAGGVGDDSLHGVALTADGSVVVAGSSTSTDLPTTAGAYDRTFGGVADGFVHMYSAVPTADSVVVNHTADGGDVNAGDGICQTATAGQCTLRAAIEEADANALIDTVRFAIPAGLASGGSWTIPLGTTLSINTAVTVDATTQPGYAGSPKVLLLGTGASNGSDAFTINGDGVVVRGFAIADFPAAGIHVAPGADATTIESNHIGTDVTGTVADGQQDDGIFADQATNLVIGGPGVGNLISGNGSAGISLANVTGAVVQGNRIGTRADGQAALANDHNGVFADGGTSLIIGGTGPGEGNLVSGNAGAGIYLQWIAGASIAGNTVGLALDGSTALGNGADGVHLEFGSVATVGPSNVVSANGSAGLASNADDVTVVGNRIGTDAGGQLDRGNAAMGVHIGGGARTQIGGDTPAERNVISGNGTDGVQFSIAGQLDAKVQGNHIGVAADGSTALGNGMRGIATFSPSRVLLGGPNTGEGNVIAHNGWQGIATNATAFDIGIVGNSIHSNSWLGIDLEGNGVTANDALDGDSGGNDRLNFPVITAVDVVAGTASVDYTLDVPTGPYVVDFFVSAAADPSGYGEGAVHAHRAAVTQSAAGSQAYTATFPAPAGAHITAVAIHHPSAGEYLDSSEFSAAFTAVGCDSDGDGLCDQWEDHNVDGDGDPATDPGPDTDGDGIPNHLDADDDGDGLPTGTEDADPNVDGHPRDALDTDRDGQPDHLDAPTVPTGAVVATEQKISDLAGGLTAAVDDGDQFGRRVTAIGDLDGDGVVDLAVGANRDDDGGLDAGAVHVLFLDADGTVTAEQKISPTSGGLTATLDPGDSFGTGLAAVGDLDGDGVVDLAVGADRDDDGGSSRGAVPLLFLHRDGTVRAEQKLSHTAGGLGVALAAGDWCGHSITALGDLDGDGVVDLAVGAPSTDGAGADRGAVYVLFLNPNGTVRARQQIGHAAGGLGAALDDGDSFGMGVSAIGDLDGDGVAELAVGAHLDDDGGANRGAVYVLFLNPDGTVRAEQKLSATAGGVGTVLDNGDWLGRSVSGIGDLDGDGTADLAVGVPGDDDGGTDRGAVLVWYLHADGTVKLEQKLSATAGGLAAALDDFDAFGNDVAGLGDLDGDGTIGLAVGANRDGDGGTDRGAVYVLDLTAFNHAPVLDGGAALTFTAITEDAFANPGDSVSDLLASAGGDPISDADGDPDGVRWIDHTGGSDNGWFEFSTDGGATWTRYGGWFWDGLLLRPTDRIRFVPAGYRAETASIELQAWDQREGGAGQVVRGVASGGTAPYSAATVTASIAVTAVNDPPTFGLTAAANAGGGADSVAVWDLEGRSERFEAVAEAPDGSIIAAGHTDTAATAGDDDLLLVRFEPDGTLDPGFGRDGHVHVPLGAGDDQAYSVAVQPDGRIVVAGSVSGLGAFVARFLADGTPDVGFGGGDGWVVVDPGVSDRFAGVAVHTDGTIAAVGWSGSDLLAARLLPDGTPDPSFGVGGSVVHVGVQQGQDVALDPTGRMVVATTVLGVVDELAAVRLTTTGALDTTFSGDGIASSPLGMTESYARGRGVDIQGDGRIVVTGTLQRSGSSAWHDDIALVRLVRFTATGALDPAFGGGSGYVRTELPGGAYWGGMEAVDIQPDGAIVTVGYADLGYKGQGDTVVVRHLADGDLDPAFGE
ncbi:MAG: right-handed parallel beta-helix repeat-containing protein, partial [Acidimicrobiales bacterium]|nr:right-handed parallel beta-helix repeat-containing protein [Acidimicrobiales bacterium]